jgi:D-galactarolactone cycloisomerase
MRIDKVEVIPLEVPLKQVFRGSYYSMSGRATLVTRIYTDEGIVGETYNGDESDGLKIARIISEEIAPCIDGRDPLFVERMWERMTPLTYDILRDRRAVVLAIAAIDSALWDVVGKTAGLPLFKVWGAYRSELPIIAIGGYYGDSYDELTSEIEGYLELGLAGCKMKVGGATPQEDAERFRTMRHAAGEDFVLIADANQGYSVAQALEFCRLTQGAGLRWFEEPVHWNVQKTGMRDIRLKTGVPVAAGQSELGRAEVLELMRHGAIDVCNFDASWAGGPTEWRKVAGMAAGFGVEMAHHEEAQVAAHLLASVPNGTYVECFHPDRDPIFWNLIENRAEIKDGMYPVPEGPGWGLILDQDWIEKYRIDR